MPERCVLHSSTILNNDCVLISGGIIDSSKIALYYDPTSSTWIETESIIASYRESSTAILLTNGQVLVTGSATASKLVRDTVEIYDLTINTWKQTTGRYYYTVIHLLDCTVLIVVGLNPSNAELYIPSSDSFISTDNPTYSGIQMTLTVLSNGYVLSTPCGDIKGNCRVLSEVYNPLNKKWFKIGFLNIERQSNIDFHISNHVLICSGDNTGGTLDNF